MSSGVQKQFNHHARLQLRLPRGEQCRQQGWGDYTYSLQSRGCIPRHCQGQGAWDMPARQPGGRAWASRGPIPTSPFLVLRLQEGQMSWIQQRPECDSVTLGPPLPGPHLPLLPADPVSSTWGCSLPPGLCSEDHTSTSLPQPRMPGPLHPLRSGSTVTHLVGFPQQSHSLLLLCPQCPCHAPPTWWY